MKFLSADPGESTGWAVWTDDQVAPVAAGTADLWDFIYALGAAFGIEGPSGPDDVDDGLLRQFRGVQHVVLEDWALYPWKVQELVWDKCRTARGIGAIEYICDVAGVPYTLQGASIKEQAEMAGAEELFYRPLDENRHANDAIRHGVVFRLMQRVATG